MTTQTSDFVVFAIGKLAINPINLSLAFPHGGVELGLVKDAVCLPTRAYSKLTAEEFGVEAVDYLDLGEASVFSVVLRWPTNNDVLTTLFPGCTTGAGSGNQVRNWPPHSNPALASDWRAGRLLSERSVKLIFTPRDQNRHPAVLLYNAVPMLKETAELNLSLENPLEFGAVFAGIRDAQDRVTQQGRIEDLTL